MSKNIDFIYNLIRKDLTAQGWTEKDIEEAIAEAIRERKTCKADDKTLCVKELSLLSDESRQILVSRLNENSIKTHILHCGNNVGKVFKILMPYMSLIAVALCLVNLLYLSKLDSDLKMLDNSVQSINTDYDDSDVIDAIENAESNIEGSIEEAKDNIRHNLILWGD